MIEIKTTTKYSFITVSPLDLYDKGIAWTPSDARIIQLKLDEKYIAFEWLRDIDYENYLNETNQIKTKICEEQNNKDLNPISELDDALDTVLLKDPQSKYGGKTLREIFDKHDEEWVSWTLENMHNKYIRDKVKFILDSGYWRV